MYWARVQELVDRIFVQLPGEGEKEYLAHVQLLNILLLAFFVPLEGRTTTPLIEVIPPYRFAIKPELPQFQILICWRVVDLLDVLAHALKIYTLLEVLIDEPFQFDFNVHPRVGFLQFLKPILQSHDLVQTLNVFCELLLCSTHQPLDLIRSKTSHDYDNNGDTDQDNSQVATFHVIEFH